MRPLRRAKSAANLKDEESSSVDENLVEAGSTASLDSFDTPHPQELRGRSNKSPWKYTCSFKEDHGYNLFSVQFNQHSKDQKVFATCGANRASIYECTKSNDIKLLRMYNDDEDECFYSCAWSYDGLLPVLAVGGKRAIIRLIYPTNVQNSTDIVSYRGHGQAINQLSFDNSKSFLLMSASKDHDIRLWNIKTHVCVAILGGADGHMDEVLYAEFSLGGNRVVSAGMDHHLKLWSLDSPLFKEAIQKSLTYDPVKTKKAFQPHREHFTLFTTRDIHHNYIDSVLDFGKFIISKSCENEVVIWRPGSLVDEKAGVRSSAKNRVTVVARLPVKDCEIWFQRISLDDEKKTLALGNQGGKIYIWNMDVDDIRKVRHSILHQDGCNAVIRQVAFSPDCQTLIACCDDASIWRWDKQS